MWEIIQANKTKSWILFILMGLCLILLGYIIGRVTLEEEAGGILGIFIAGIIWFILSLISYFSGDSIILAVSGAKEVTPDVHPQLFNVVEEMKIAASLPFMPKVYIINEAAPNAFATGRKPEKSSIAVTAGLLNMMNRNELQGVIAHEMSHIINRDVLFMTFAGIMLGSIVLIADIFLRGLWHSSSRSSRVRFGGSPNDKGQLQVIIMIIAIVFAILAPIIARLIYFAISRKREYLADASAIRLTRYPEGLASALEKISGTNLDLVSANKVTAPMYIVNPLKGKGLKIADLTSTHPPISERVKILRNITSATYLNYQQAFSTIKGKATPILPPSGLRDNKDIPLLSPTGTEEKSQDSKTSMRNLGDLMRTVNGYAFLTCLCGLKIKLPPTFKEPKVKCPKCQRLLDSKAI